MPRVRERNNSLVEQVKAKDKWINRLLCGVDEISKENDLEKIRKTALSLLKDDF